MMTVGTQNKSIKPKSKVTLSKALTKGKQDYDKHFPPLSPTQISTTPKDSKNVTTVKQTSPTTTDSCCKCSKMSGCKTARCPCFVACTPCTTCNGRLCAHYNKSSSMQSQNPSPIKETVTSNCPEPPVEADISSKATMTKTANSPAPKPPVPSPKQSPTNPPTTVVGDDDPSQPSSSSDADDANPIPDYLTLSDLPGYQTTDVDQKLYEVYGDYIHQNDGTHLDGGIENNDEWAEQWRRLVSLPQKTYDVPKGKVGRKFTTLLAVELNNVLDRKSNAEKFLAFQICMLVKDKKVKKSSDIKRRIWTRMEAWENQFYPEMIDDTVETLKINQSRLTLNESKEKRTKIFHSLILKGELRRAVRYLTDRESGGVLFPDQVDSKSGKLIKDVLPDKHPQARIPSATLFNRNPADFPNLLDIDVSECHIAQVSSKLTGAAGLSGFDSHNLKLCMLRFGKESKMLRESVADLVRLLANEYPNWAMYRAFMSGRLIALDKMPGIRPIGIGEIWRRLFAKTVIHLTGSQAQKACGKDQLCSGIKAGIEGGIHAASQFWEENNAEDSMGFLLIDAKNAFNEINRARMLYEVCFHWPKGALFVFNCYKHWSQMVLRNNNDQCYSLHSEEGVTQGDPLSMIVYGIATLPIIQKLKSLQLQALQIWYADDASIGGKFEVIKKLFQLLQTEGPKYGYFPEPKKCVLIVHPNAITHAKEYFKSLQFEISTGNRFLGGFIGDEEEMTRYVNKKIYSWTTAVEDLAFAAQHHPQTAYCGLTKSLQHEWNFLLRTVPNIAQNFAPLQQSMDKFFIPNLFGTPLSKKHPSIKELISLPVKYSGLSIANPTTSTTQNDDSKRLTSYLVECLYHDKEFAIADHTNYVIDTRKSLKIAHTAEHTMQMLDILQKLPPFEQRALERGGDTGHWLSVLPSLTNDTLLSPQEFRDGLSIRYALHPTNLPTKCDGCAAPNSVTHAFKCKVGGLVVQRHDEIVDQLGQLCTQALTRSAVHAEPIISKGCTVNQDKNERTQKDNNTNSSSSNNKQTASTPKDLRGDLIIRGLWEKGTDCIIDVRVTDTDQASYRKYTPIKVLEMHEDEKKKKYGKKCHEIRKTFSPFITSADGMIGKEAKAILKNISVRLADKWDITYSKVRGYVNAKISIAIIRAAHRCLRCSRIPTTRITRTELGERPWDDGAGLGLFTTH